MSLSVETTSLAACTCEATEFTVFHDWAGDPVRLGIVPNGSMLRIAQDYLEILVSSILRDPVAVQNSQVSALPADALFRDAALIPRIFQLCDPLVLGLTVLGTLRHRTLPTSTTHSHAINDIPLLRFVSNTTGLVRTCWPRGTVNRRELAILPRANTTQEAHNITLLVTPQLLKILVGSHTCRRIRPMPYSPTQFAAAFTLLNSSPIALTAQAEDYYVSGLNDKFYSVYCSRYRRRFGMIQFCVSFSIWLLYHNSKILGVLL